MFDRSNIFSGLKIIQSQALEFKSVAGWFDIPYGQRPKDSDWRTTSKCRQWKTLETRNVPDALGTMFKTADTIFMTPAMYRKVCAEVVVKDPIKSFSKSNLHGIYNFGIN